MASIQLENKTYFDQLQTDNQIQLTSLNDYQFIWLSLSEQEYKSCFDSLQDIVQAIYPLEFNDLRQLEQKLENRDNSIAQLIALCQYFIATKTSDRTIRTSLKDLLSEQTKNNLNVFNQLIIQKCKDQKEFLTDQINEIIKKNNQYASQIITSQQQEIVQTQTQIQIESVNKSIIQQFLDYQTLQEDQLQSLEQFKQEINRVQLTVQNYQQKQLKEGEIILIAHENIVQNYNKVVNQYKYEIQSLKDQEAEFQKQLLLASQEIENQKQIINQQNIDILALRRMNQELTNNLNDQQVQDQINQLQSIITNLKDDKQSLQNQLNQYDDQLKKIQQEFNQINETYQIELNQLQETNFKQNSQILSLSAQIKLLEAEVDTTKLNLLKDREDYKSIESNYQQELQRQEQILKQKNEEIEKEKKLFEQKILTTIEAQREEIQKKEEEKQTLLQQVTNELKQRIQAIQEESKKQIDKIISQSQQNEKIIVDKELEISQLKNKLQSEKQSINSINLNYQEDKRKIENQYKQLLLEAEQKNKQEIVKLNEQIAIAQLKATLIEGQENIYQTNIENLKKLISSYEQTITSQNQKIQQLELDIQRADDIKIENEQLKQQIILFNEYKNIMNEEINNPQFVQAEKNSEETEILRQEILKLQQKLSVISNLQNQQNEKIFQTDQPFQTLAELIQTLQNNLNQNLSLSEYVEARRGQVNQALESILDQLKNFTQRIDQNTQLLKQKENQIQAQLATIKSQEQQLIILNQTIQNLKQSNKQKQMVNQNQEDFLLQQEQLMSQITELKIQNQIANQSNVQLNLQLQQKNNQIKDLEIQLKQIGKIQSLVENDSHQLFIKDISQQFQIAQLNPLPEVIQKFSQIMRSYFDTYIVGELRTDNLNQFYKILLNNSSDLQQLTEVFRQILQIPQEYDETVEQKIYEQIDFEKNQIQTLKLEIISLNQKNKQNNQSLEILTKQYNEQILMYEQLQSQFKDQKQQLQLLKNLEQQTQQTLKQQEKQIAQLKQQEQIMEAKMNKKIQESINVQATELKQRLINLQLKLDQKTKEFENSKNLNIIAQQQVDTLTQQNKQQQELIKQLEKQLFFSSEEIKKYQSQLQLITNEKDSNLLFLEKKIADQSLIIQDLQTQIQTIKSQPPQTITLYKERPVAIMAEKQIQTDIFAQTIPQTIDIEVQTFQEPLVQTREVFYETNLINFNIFRQVQEEIKDSIKNMIDDTESNLFNSLLETTAKIYNQKSQGLNSIIDKIIFTNTFDQLLARIKQKSRDLALEQFSRGPLGNFISFIRGGGQQAPGQPRNQAPMRQQEDQIEEEDDEGDDQEPEEQQPPEDNPFGQLPDENQNPFFNLDDLNEMRQIESIQLVDLSDLDQNDQREQAAPDEELSQINFDGAGCEIMCLLYKNTKKIQLQGKKKKVVLHFMQKIKNLICENEKILRSRKQLELAI